jgi:hypothetical protein
MLVHQMSSRLRWAHDRLTAAMILVGIAAGGGCNRGRVVDSSLPRTTPAARTADSFVHCVEAGTSNCIEAGENHGGWDALHLLIWLASGSPLAILDVLPRELAAHTNHLEVQGSFVREVERYAEALRGAECQSVATRPLAPLVDQAARVAQARLERVGLWRPAMAKVVAGLVEEAHEDLDEGQLVRLDCGYDPYRVYLVTRPRDGRIRVVGMTTTLAPVFGGDDLDPRSVQTRLESPTFGLAGSQAPIQEDTIDSWLRFPVEDL